MNGKWRVLAHHRNWVEGANITETIRDNGERRFTATIRGWQNWKIWMGTMRCVTSETVVAIVKKRVVEIRDRIDSGDEAVFTEPNEYDLTTA